MIVKRLQKMLVLMCIVFLLSSLTCCSKWGDDSNTTPTQNHVMDTSTTGNTLQSSESTTGTLNDDDFGVTETNTTEKDIIPSPSVHETAPKEKPDIGEGGTQIINPF